MIYSYTITEMFLKDLANLEYGDSKDICSFLKNNFLKKENLYLKMDRDILEKNYKIGALSNDRIDKLIKDLSNEIKDVLIKKDIPIDFGLVGSNEKKGIDSFTCEDILKKEEELEKKISDKIIDQWPIDEGDLDIKKLEYHFKRILCFNSKLILNYRYIVLPVIQKLITNEKIDKVKKELSEIKDSEKLKKTERFIEQLNKDKSKFSIQIEYYKRFLKFLSDLRNRLNIEVKINSPIPKRLIEDIEEYGLNYKNELEKLFEPFFRGKDKAFIKNGSSQKIWKLSHGRYLITILHDAESEEELLENDINIFEAQHGLQIIREFKGKNSISDGKEIDRKPFKKTKFLWKNSVKIIENAEDFLKISA